MKTIYNSRFNQEDFELLIKDYMEYNDDVEYLTEDQKLDIYYKELDLWFDAEQCNLDVELNNNIIAITDVGRWNGRSSGYKVLNNNLSSIMNSFGCDDFKIYVENKNVYFEGWHHDGYNSILFREVKNPDNIDKFLDKIYEGETITNSMLNYYTRSIYKDVKNVYGF